MSPTTTFPGSSLGSFGQPPDHFCASTSPQKNGEQRQAGTHWLTARMKHLDGESHPWREENGIHTPDVLRYLGPRGLRFPCPDRNHRTGQYRSIAATYLARKGKNNRGRAGYRAQHAILTVPMAGPEGLGSIQNSLRKEVSGSHRIGATSSRSLLFRSPSEWRSRMSSPPRSPHQVIYGCRSAGLSPRFQRTGWLTCLYS